MGDGRWGAGMKHVPVFRWVAVLGLILFAWAVGLNMSGSGSDDLKQINLVVLSEKPSGACRVQWGDPFNSDIHEAFYQCDPDRDPILKAPNYDPDSGHGWDTGFVYTSGARKGELYPLNGDVGADTGGITLADGLLGGGLILLVTGFLGGNIRSLARTTSVNPDVVRRARRLRDAAALVAQDHRLAVEAVREAWSPEAALTDPELLAALRVLVEAGPRAHKVAAAAAALTARLDPLLAAAAPAATRRTMLAASREERRVAGLAVGELDAVLHDAEIRDVAQQFAQTSVDLLRGPDNAPASLSATVDFESRRADYYRVLTEVVGVALPPTSL